MASKPQGGGVVSGQTHGKTEWVAPGSMDTKAEGKNIQLLGDAMTNNGGSPANASTLPGVGQSSAMANPTAEEKLREVACKCDRQVKPNKQSTCIELGSKKHECCEKELRRHKSSGKPPSLRGERGYEIRAGSARRLRASRKSVEARTAAEVRRGGLYGGTSEVQMRQAIWKELRRSLRGTCWPDACSLDGKGNPSQLFDFKFQCPKGTRIRRKKGGGWVVSKGGSMPVWRKGQYKKYKQLSEALGIDLLESPPLLIDTLACP
nr:hypothetical protein [Archangium disciforme]